MPLLAIDAVEASASLSFSAGCRREAQLFHQCLKSDQSKAQMHVFWSERAAAKRIEPSGEAGPPIRRAAVVGAGTMGTGIAIVYANAGIPVILKDADAHRLEKGWATIRAQYEADVEKGRLTTAAFGERMSRIRTSLEYDGFENVDIVVEAVNEDLDLKRRIFGELSAIVRPDAILATNTSSLNIDDIASTARDARRVFGHHFFSPASRMRLLEIVRGRATSPAVLASSMAASPRHWERSACSSAIVEDLLATECSIGIFANPCYCWRRAPVSNRLIQRCTTLAWPWAHSEVETWRGSIFGPRLAIKMSRRRAAEFRSPTNSTKGSAGGADRSRFLSL